MIRFGVSGIPLSCKWRSLKEGVTFVKQLGLDAMEVRMFKDLGLDEEELREVGEAAKFHGIRLSVHAPSYVDLSTDERDGSIEKVKSCGLAAQNLGADVVVVHPGFYYDGVDMNAVIGAMGEIGDFFSENGIKAKVGVETMGKKKSIGSPEEVIEICKNVKNAIPVIDFAHIHARFDGGLKTKDDFENIFKAVNPLRLKEYYIHFSGVYFDENGERYHLPIKRDMPKFEHLASALLDRKKDARIICESPVLEHDAHYMMIILDRVKEKKMAKERSG